MKGEGREWAMLAPRLYFQSTHTHFAAITDSCLYAFASFPPWLGQNILQLLPNPNSEVNSRP